MLYRTTVWSQADTEHRKQATPDITRTLAADEETEHNTPDITRTLAADEETEHNPPDITSAGNTKTYVTDTVVPKTENN